MTVDKALFISEEGPGRIPLFEGKMTWQFSHDYAKPRYRIDESEGRAALLKRQSDSGQHLPYQSYRLAFRDIAANTNERTLIATVVPPAFLGNKLPSIDAADENGRPLISLQQQRYLCAVWNSVVVDWAIRQKVTTTLNFFYIYQTSVPRPADDSDQFRGLVSRTARMTCTTKEFDGLANQAGLRDHRDGATDPTERARLRAEIDGLVAHLYGLSEAEFVHILATFPLVPEPVKQAARNAYRDVERGLIQ